MKLVDLGWRNQFPDDAGAEWQRAGAKGAARAAAQLAWAEDQELVHREQHSELLGNAPAALDEGFGAVEAHLLSQHGADTIIPQGSLTPGRYREVLDSGGSIVLREAERWSAAIARRCALMATARSTRVTAWLIRGSEPTGILEAEADSVCVLPLSHSAIVHQPDGVPFDARPGRLVRCEGAPRILSKPLAYSLLFIERRISSKERIGIVSSRALAHPLLRIDMPLDLAKPAEVYGLDGSIHYPDLLTAEWTGLLDSAGEEAVRRWWILSKPMTPVVSPIGQQRCRVEGRFPGGIGVSEVDDIEYVHAGGAVMLLDDDEKLTLLRLLEGTVLDVAPSFENLDLIAWLAAAGLLEISLVEPVQTRFDPSNETERWSITLHVDGADLELRGSGGDIGVAAHFVDLLGGYAPAVARPLASLQLEQHHRGWSVSSTVAWSHSQSLSPLVVRETDLDRTVLSWLDEVSMRMGEPSRLRLHGALIGTEPSWVVIGGSGAGKSTIAISAAARGLTVASDERVSVIEAMNGLKVRGMHHPIRSIAEGDGARYANPHERDLRSMESFDEPTRLLILGGSDGEVVSASWVLAEMLRHVRNLGSVGLSAFNQLISLMSQCLVYVAPVRSIGDLDDLSEMEELDLGDLSASRLVVLASDDATDRKTGLNPAATTFAVGNGCVVWIPGEPQCVVNMEGDLAARWIAVVDGVEDVEVLDYWREQLFDIGLLAGQRDLG